MDGNAFRVLSEAGRAIGEAQARCFARAIEARKGLEAARKEYDEALLDADAVGLSNTDIARAAGTSEAAIRLYIKRRKDRQS